MIKKEGAKKKCAKKHGQFSELAIVTEDQDIVIYLENQNKHNFYLSALDGTDADQSEHDLAQPLRVLGHELVNGHQLQRNALETLQTIHTCENE